MEIGTVLVLEDEPFIALDMEEMLRGFGATSVKSLDSRTDALEWLASNVPDVAIIDPRLNDGLCTDVVERLAEMSVPFIVYSGASVEPTDAFAKGEWLGKPTLPEMLKASLQRVIGA